MKLCNFVIMENLKAIRKAMVERFRNVGNNMIILTDNEQASHRAAEEVFSWISINVACSILTRTFENM